jgi:hypothetical protein
MPRFEVSMSITKAEGNKEQEIGTIHRHLARTKMPSLIETRSRVVLFEYRMPCINCIQKPVKTMFSIDRQMYR